MQRCVAETDPTVVGFAVEAVVVDMAVGFGEAAVGGMVSAGAGVEAVDATVEVALLEIGAAVEGSLVEGEDVVTVSFLRGATALIATTTTRIAAGTHTFFFFHHIGFRGAAGCGGGAVDLGSAARVCSVHRSPSHQRS